MNERQDEKHQPRPADTTRSSSAQPSEPAEDATSEVEQATQDLHEGSLREHFEQLGEEIDMLLVEASQDPQLTNDRQRELDKLKQEYQLALEDLDEFQSETAGDWEAFRAALKKRRQQLQERFNEMRRQFSRGKSGR